MFRPDSPTASAPSDFADVEYKCNNLCDPSDERRIIWSDPSIGIQWPSTNPLLSNKDCNARTLDELTKFLARHRER